MLASFYVFIPFGETEVDYVDNFSFFLFTNHKIISFDISMNESFSMNLLKPGNNLYPDIESCCKVEIFSALLKKVYQSWKRSYSECSSKSMTINSL